MGRVVIDGFDSLFALGLQDLLRDDEVEMCPADHDCDEGVQLAPPLPDVVLLNTERDSTPRIVDELVTRYPAITVITCSSGVAEMRVYPAHHGGESYRCPLEAGEIGRQIHR